MADGQVWSIRAGLSRLLPDPSQSVIYARLTAWTRTHLYSHLVHSEVLRCHSHVFSDCVLSLQRSFSHLMEKFFLAAVNLQKTNHHILCTMVTHTVFSLTAHWDNYWSISCHIVAFVHSPPPAFSGDCFCGFLYIRLSPVQDSSVELWSGFIVKSTQHAAQNISIIIYF